MSELKTIIASKTFLKDLVKSELAARTEYVPHSIWIYILIISIATFIVIVLLCYAISEYEEGPAIFAGLMTLCVLVGCIAHYNSIEDGNKKLGLSKKVVENCITSQETSLVIPITTDTNLDYYKSQYSISVEVVDKEGRSVGALALDTYKYTTFIEDTTEYIAVPCITYRLNSPSVKDLISPELNEQIEKSAYYGSIKEVHYNPNKKKNDISSEQENNIKVIVNTDVNVLVE